LELLQESHHRVGWLVGRVGHPRHSATFIVKGTYDLRPGAAVAVAPEQLELSPDIHAEDDPGRSLRYSSDFAYFKPRADIFAVGRFHAPRGEAVTESRVGISVGQFTKTLLVVGNRYWLSATPGSGASTPHPFTEMDLTYERAFGGDGFPENPLGKGTAKVLTPAGTAVWPLPNVEHPAAMVTSPDSRPSPAGFGPYPLMWPQRLSKAGTYDETWKRTRWPWFPDNFDWGFFNAAPPDQQVDGYLQGDETVQLINLHREYEVYETRLPEIRPRCFYAPVAGAPLYFQEVPLNLDTLWIDAESEKLVLIWRGVVTLRHDDLGGQDRLLVVSESLREEPRSLSHYEGMCRSLMQTRDSIEDDQQSVDLELDADEVLETITGEQQNDHVPASPETAAFDAAVAAVDISEPPAVTREWCMARYADGDSFEGLDLSGVDLSDLALPGARFHNAILTDSFFRRTNLRDADFSGAVLAAADFTDADLSNASLGGADLTAARLVRCSLHGATLVGADLTGAVLRHADMTAVLASGVVMTGANLLEADLTGADLTDADLSRTQLHMVTLTRARMKNASIESAVGFPVVADAAHLVGLRASGAILWESSFRFAQASGAIWQSAELRDSDFTGARLDKAEFEGASLERANFTCAVLRHARFLGADLREARMTNCDLLGASLEKADLGGASLAYANLFSAEILDTELDGADLSHANITRTMIAPSS
jgi:uncharacterized protein YjbI with pentapeptide repeats